MKLFILIFLIFLFRIPFDFIKYGIIAIRDGTHYIEILFFFVLINELNIMRIKGLDITCFCNKYINIILNIMFLYSLFIFNRQFLLNISPKYYGYQNKIFLFGNFAGTYTWLLALIMINLFKVNNRYSCLLHLQNVIALAIILFATSRITIISYLFFIVFFIIIKDFKKVFHLSIYLIMLTLIALSLIVIGLSIELHRGELNLNFIKLLIQSVIGVGESGMASGFHQRIEWINIILKDSFSNFEFIFGRGFGMHLTSFAVAGGIKVREPHNSLISIYARMGIVGLLMWFGSIICIFKINIRNYFRTNNYFNYISMVIIISAMLNCLAEPFFEMPQTIIPFYTFLGILNYNNLISSDVL